MVERNFKLPGIQELSKEQERIRALPKKGRYLIVGGPGTGKSVLALLRAKRYHNDNDYLYLVYNRLLKAASYQLVEEQLNSATWKSWFCKLYQSTMGEPIPLGEEQDNWQPIQWDETLHRIAAADKLPLPAAPFLIIDEGQDMPPEFYEALANMQYEHFFVVADQNQQITKENSTRRDLEDKLVIDSKDVIVLRENYRNAYPVACLAQTFCTGGSEPLELMKIKQCEEKPLMVEYGKGCRFDFSAVVDHILKWSDREPSKLVGVITPNNRVREKYLSALRNSAVHLDNGSPRIETYAFGEKCNITFDQGGITVINSQSCKGLEFDRVFLADIHEYRCDSINEDEIKRRFYVMTARARERVILLCESGRPCPVETILPKDENILGRWR